MEREQIVAAFNQMLESGTPLNEAITVMQTAFTEVQPDERLVLDQLRNENPGLSDQEIQVLFSREFPEDSDDDGSKVMRKARVQQKAKEIAALKQQAAKEKVTKFLPSNEEAIRRAEAAKTWSPKISELVENVEIDFEEVRVKPTLSNEQKQVIAAALVDFAIQQGLEIKDEMPELADYAQRLALSMGDKNVVRNAIKAQMAQLRQNLVNEFVKGERSRITTSPKINNLPKTGGGYV